MISAVMRWASLFLLLGLGTAAAEDKVGKDCSFKGKRLWGKVQFVSSGADLKIELVTAFADLKVLKVTAFPDSCGKWQTVTAYPDLKVQVVTAYSDLKVQYVTAFPGVP